jgi:hypothetical protein
MRTDLFSEFTVAANAIGFEDLGVARLDADGFLEILEGEGLGMVVAIAGLHEELVDEVVVGQVAVVAHGVGMVRSMPPVVVLLPHDMAVHAYLRIVGQVGKPVGSDKGVSTRAKESANEEAG